MLSCLVIDNLLLFVLLKFHNSTQVMKPPKNILKPQNSKAHDKKREKYVLNVIEPTKRLAKLLAEMDGQKPSTLRRRSA